MKRPLDLFLGNRWIGNAICYGPHRNGQFPGGPAPTESELREDLHLMAEHWSLLRLYGSVGPAETILQVIHDDRIDMKVILGVWIGAEERRDEAGVSVEQFPDARAANRREIDSAIRLAAAYPEIVFAVAVGNETQVFWSGHRSPVDVLITYVRETRARVAVPVTVADDFNYWNKPESVALARELDFLLVHAHPLWNGLQLEEAIDWTQRTLAQVQAQHPSRLLVLGETGWATQRHTEGEQAKLIRGELGEPAQDAFYKAMTGWVERHRVPTFFFEAFDENWKGGEHPDEVEKHWGLYRADRTAKKALIEAP